MATVGSKSFNVDLTELQKATHALGAPEPIVDAEMKTGMQHAGELARDSARRHIRNRSGALSASGKVEVTQTGKTTEARVRFTTPYAAIVNDGRGPVVAHGRALRFEIGGEVFFRHSVGPAAGVHYAEKGLEDAKGPIQRELEQTADRIAKRMEAAL